jgi:hypothetical protein
MGLTLKVLRTSEFFFLVGLFPFFVAEEYLKKLDNLLPVYFFAAFAITGTELLTVLNPIADTRTGRVLHEKSNIAETIKAPNFKFPINVFMT